MPAPQRSSGFSQGIVGELGLTRLEMLKHTHIPAFSKLNTAPVHHTWQADVATAYKASLSVEMFI